MITLIDGYINCEDIKVLHESLQLIKNNTLLLFYYINTLLDYSEIIKAQLELAREEFNLNAAISKILDLIRNEFNIKQIELCFEYTSSEIFIVNDMVRV